MVNQLPNLNKSLLAWIVLSGFFSVNAQEQSQQQYWFELVARDQSFSDSASREGRASAFREFLGEGSVVFRSGGPKDAQDIYAIDNFQGNEISWKAHYVDVSRDGDLGLSAGPLIVIGDEDNPDDTWGHMVSIWRKQEVNWQLMADIVVNIPGVLSLEVEPNFEDTQPVLEETAHPEIVSDAAHTLQDLIDADNLFGLSINFRGGQRALLRYGLENARVYLPGMAPAVGAEAASSVYGAYLDSQLFTTNPITLSYVGGYLSTSKEMGYTYGTMATSGNEADQVFQTSYLRLWRFTNSNEWKIAVEMLSPF